MKKLTFKDRLANLGFNTYREYLYSEHWLEFRQLYFASGLPTICAVCHSRNVHLHHLTYERLGREEFTDVVPLCKKHHDRVHDCLRKQRMRVEQTASVVLLLRSKASRERKSSLRSAGRIRKRKGR